MNIAELINNVLDVEYIEEIVLENKDVEEVTSYANKFFTPYCVELV